MLLKKERQKKAVILFSKKYNWLQVAALFLMLAGSGWLIYRLSLPGKNEIAVTTANRQTAPEKPAINQPSDTTAALTTELAKEKQHTDESPVTKEFNNKPTVEKQDIPPVETENKNKLKADTEQVTANQPALVATTPENRVSSTFQAPAENRTVNANKNISANAGAAVSNEATRNGETAYDKKSTIQRDSVAGLAGVQGRAQKAEMARDTGKTLNMVMQPVK